MRMLPVIVPMPMPALSGDMTFEEFLLVIAICIITMVVTVALIELFIVGRHRDVLERFREIRRRIRPRTPDETPYPNHSTKER